MVSRYIALVAIAAVSLAIPTSARADFGGLYIGSHIGGNFPSIDVLGEFDNGAPTAYELEPDGWTAGIHLGYTLPVQGALIGIEAAWSAANEVDTRPAATGGGTADDFASFVFNDTFSIAARFGFFLAPRYMPFVKIGIAWADIEGQAGDTAGVPPRLDDSDVIRTSDWETGFVVGTGLEVLWAHDWSVRAEYEYMDFGSSVIVNADGDANRVDVQNHAIKFGISRHF
jgi:outer membrane immunogenic protein